jgi:hypothetical protein
MEFEAGPRVISPLEGEMPGRAEGGVITTITILFLLLQVQGVDGDLKPDHV